MGQHRTHVILPEGLVTEIDALVGQRKRSAFLAEVAARELRRRRLLAFLAQDVPAWNPADHPDIEKAGGAAAWVKKLRRESDQASRRRLRSRRG
ncbi:MAG: hypothetical protein LAN62_13335 [Acidobacteriia bacterium]|nr:hypothetical protein [Terriglobia bacterium]